MKRIPMLLGTILLLISVYAPAFALTPTQIKPIDDGLRVNTVESSDLFKLINDPAAIKEFKDLPLAQQTLIRKKVLAGEEFTKEELVRIPPLLREDIVSIVGKTNKTNVDGQTQSEKNLASKSGGSSFESFISEYWVQFLALVVSLIGVTLAVTGFTFAGSKKKKSISRFINEIDDTFSSFKWKSKRCEAELYRLQDLVEDKLKEGKIDEGAYHLLVHRIEKYLAEVKDVDGIPNKASGKVDPL